MPIIDCRTGSRGTCKMWETFHSLEFTVAILAAEGSRNSHWSKWRKGWGEVGHGSHSTTMADREQAVTSHTYLWHFMKELIRLLFDAGDNLLCQRQLGELHTLLKLLNKPTSKHCLRRKPHIAQNEHSFFKDIRLILYLCIYLYQHITKICQWPHPHYLIGHSERLNNIRYHYLLIINQPKETITKP